MARVELQELTRIYSGRTVVDHINLDIQDGTLVSILGPSGCGKTTTLRMIAGFEMPDGGDVLFDGSSIGSTPVNKRNIGMVFQSYALFPHMTVAKNVAYGLEQQGTPAAEIRERVHEALDMVHMAEFADRKPGQLSGGQQQRVALARALVIRPRVMLLDECLSALDKKLRVEMQTELRRILEETGVTTFFVTHDQEEAMTLSDQIVVMRDGKIEQTGSPFEVYEHPKTRFVSGFLGKANLIQREDGTSAIRPEKIRIASGEESGARQTGVIQSIVYSGNITRYTVDCGSCEMEVERSYAGSDGLLERGERVSLTWDDASEIKLID